MMMMSVRGLWLHVAVAADSIGRVACAVELADLQAGWVRAVGTSVQCQVSVFSKAD
jgi:hypothetical protein